MNMLLSVVTGTYNRLPQLKKMVESVRRSVGLGMDLYEIVVVDGGSSDGTLEWARLQPDISLIEQGELLGAVKAFNAGAEAARGYYVVLANDDITFEDYTLAAALSFIMDHQDRVGIGAIYQDRGGKGPHVETMPCIIGGEQKWLPYGQVCIIPKHLGDAVGWWGDYLRTYGGDNEMSCRVYELGYMVEPVPCSMIHDGKLEDGLRQRNTELNVATGESQKWLARWTRDGKTGPILPTHPAVKWKPLDVKRILYAPICEEGLQMVTRRGLYNALSIYGPVLEVDYLHTNPADLVDLACAWDPSLFILQLQDYQGMKLDTLRQLRANHPNAKFVNWNGDYHPNNLMHPSYIELMRLFDYAGFVTADIEGSYTRQGIKYHYWQIGYEPSSSEPASWTPKHDVVFLANGYSTARLNLAKHLRSLGVDVGLYGTWPKYLKADGYCLYDFDGGARLYKAAKLAIGDSQWPDATGYTSNRLFQALAAGAFLLQQGFDGMTQYLGLKDGEHLITWTDLDDLTAKIKYWLAPERAKERAKIARAGQQYIFQRHSFDVRVSELFEALELC